MKFTRVLLDYGHGGTDPVTGKYLTPGAKQYRFDDHDGLWIGEGNTNRETAWRLMTLLLSTGVELHDVVARRRVTSPPALSHLEPANVSLGARVRYANQFDPKSSLFVSLHSNAQGDNLAGPSRAWRGISVYTSIGQTRSDDVADDLIASFRAATKGSGPLGRARVLRGEWADGDADHEANFYVLRKTLMPAVLGEVLFFTNIDDARILLSCEGQDAIARAYFEGLRGFLPER